MRPAMYSWASARPAGDTLRPSISPLWIASATRRSRSASVIVATVDVVIPAFSRSGDRTPRSQPTPASRNGADAGSGPIQFRDSVSGRPRPACRGPQVGFALPSQKRSLPVGTVVSLTRRPFDQGSTARRTWPATPGRQTEGHAATVRCPVPRWSSRPCCPASRRSSTCPW